MFNIVEWKQIRKNLFYFLKKDIPMIETNLNNFSEMIYPFGDNSIQFKLYRDENTNEISIFFVNDLSEEDEREYQHVTRNVYHFLLESGIDCVYKPDPDYVYCLDIANKDNCYQTKNWIATGSKSKLIVNSATNLDIEWRKSDGIILNHPTIYKSKSIYIHFDYENGFVDFIYSSDRYKEVICRCRTIQEVLDFYSSIKDERTDLLKRIENIRQEICFPSNQYLRWDENSRMFKTDSSTVVLDISKVIYNEEFCYYVRGPLVDRYVSILNDEFEEQLLNEIKLLIEIEKAKHEIVSYMKIKDLDSFGYKNQVYFVGMFHTFDISINSFKQIESLLNNSFHYVNLTCTFHEKGAIDKTFEGNLFEIVLKMKEIINEISAKNRLEQVFEQKNDHREIKLRKFFSTGANISKIVSSIEKSELNSIVDRFFKEPYIKEVDYSDKDKDGIVDLNGAFAQYSFPSNMIFVEKSKDDIKSQYFYKN